MKRYQGLLFGIGTVIMLALSGCGEQGKSVTVPISGEYYESHIGGWLRYGGTLTYTWTSATPSAGEAPYDVAFWAQGWCVNTGAAYRLFGHNTQISIGLPTPFMAYDGAGQVAYEGMVAIGLPQDAGEHDVTGDAVALSLPRR